MFVTDYIAYENTFTDGLKSADAAAAALVTGKQFSKELKAKLPKCSSILFAEKKALLLA